MFFFGSADDIQLIRKILTANGNNKIKIIAKIERPVALKNIDSIISVSDAIMVARGVNIIQNFLEISFQLIKLGFGCWNWHMGSSYCPKVHCEKMQLWRKTCYCCYPGKMWNGKSTFLTHFFLGFGKYDHIGKTNPSRSQWCF